jgi:hypothetical protein
MGIPGGLYSPNGPPGHQVRAPSKRVDGRSNLVADQPAPQASPPAPLKHRERIREQSIAAAAPVMPVDEVPALRPIHEAR